MDAFCELDMKSFCSHVMDLLRFTVCDVCEQLKAQLHDHSIPLQIKLGDVRTYRAHLRDQYMDRSTCWQLCDVANAREGDTLVCWLDGMEQAKFSVPRHRGLRTASATSCPQNVVCTCVKKNFNGES